MSHAAEYDFKDEIRLALKFAMNGIENMPDSKQVVLKMKRKVIIRERKT